MNCAVTADRRLEKSRLMVIQAGGLVRGDGTDGADRADGADGADRADESGIHHRLVENLVDQFRRGDVLVVNDVATIPASLTGYLKPLTIAVDSNPDALVPAAPQKQRGNPADGRRTAVEVRLASLLRSDHFSDKSQIPQGMASQKASHLQRNAYGDYSRWTAVLLGAGDWRSPTENRPPPPVVRVGDQIEFGAGFSARVLAVHHQISQRLVDIQFNGPLEQIYQHGRVVQYSYMRGALELWDRQTIFSGTPIAVEPPSSAFVLTWKLYFALQAAGVEIVPITHATGLSSTGDPAIDAALPLSEPYLISKGAQQKLRTFLRERRRIVAVGTGVVRALETWGGKSSPEWGVSELKISPSHKLKVANGLLTGMHDPMASHLHLLSAFVGDDVLKRAYSEAESRGYLWHEYGDVCLIFGRSV